MNEALHKSNTCVNYKDSEDGPEGYNNDIWDIGNASPFGLRKEYNKKGVKKLNKDDFGNKSIMFSKDNIQELHMEIITDHLKSKIL